MLLDNLAEKLNPLETKALSLFDRATDKALNLDDYVVNSITNSVGISLTNWLNQHPLIAWLVSHPLITLVVSFITAILLVRLILTIYRVIASTIDRMWLAILRSPFAILKFLFGWEAKPKDINRNTTITNYEVTNDSARLEEIVTRLDLIQQQQQEIIQELALLKQQPLTIEPQQLRLVEKKIGVADLKYPTRGQCETDKGA